MKKQIISLLILTSTSFSSGFADTDPVSWLKSVPVPEGVYTEMYGYFKKDSSKQAQAYVADFIPNFHSRMADRALNVAQNQSGACKPYVKSETPKQVSNGFNFETKVAFEGKFLKIESVACLGKLDIEKVFQTLMSERYQRAVIDGLQSIRFLPENRVCVIANTSMLSLDYCVTKQVLKSKTQYIIQSFNEKNCQTGSDNCGADKIYFKDTINIITKLPNGEISFYNLMFARGKAFPGLFSGAVRSNADKAYEISRDNLINFSR